MPGNEEVFKNIDHSNTTISRPFPDKITDIDTKNKIYDNIIDGQINGTLDIAQINNFTSISRARNQVYDLLDQMGEDPIISSALEIYAADACEPNEEGRIMWAEAEDSRVSTAINQILDSFNIDKNAYSHIYALCKYGDLYGRLYRESEFLTEEEKGKKKNLNEDLDSKSLEEKLILKIYSKNDRYAEYMEAEKNPAEIFDLVKFGKTCAYIKTNIPETSINKDDIIGNTALTNQFNFRFKENDVELFGATEYVHACLEDTSDRISEEVSLFTDGETNTESDLLKFSVRRGQSILYNSFKIWRELSLLENSVMLNRLTKSSIIRTLNVEVGDMGKTEVQTLLHRIKSLVEQKTAYNSGLSMKDYVSAGPIENVLYFPTHNGQGAVTTSQIGGDVDQGQLTDLDYWKNKLYGSLGIPKMYLGDTDDAAGFNGGTSLSLISSRYAKAIRRIQNAYIQMITDAVNLILLDRGLLNYVNKYSLKMTAPATQEEKDRKDSLATSINNVRETMSLLDPIEDNTTKLEILKSLLSHVITNTDVIGFIDDEIQKLKEEEEMGTGEEPAEGEGGDEFDFDSDLGGEDVGGASSAPLDFGGGEDTGELPSPADLDMGGGEEAEQPVESFYSGDGELLTEEEANLPSWDDLGVSYNEI